jgi:hypothetical protein
MAKLNPKDPQFGIPVAARIRKDLAFMLNKEAKNQNISFSKYLSGYLEKTFALETKIEELKTQFTKEQETFKRTAALFILKISAGDKKQATEHIETYNSILKSEKQIEKKDEKTK